MAAFNSGNPTAVGSNTLSGLPDNAKTDSACGGVITGRRITSIPWMKKKEAIQRHLNITPFQNLCGKIGNP